MLDMLQQNFNQHSSPDIAPRELVYQLFDKIPVGIIIVNCNCEIYYLNNALFQFLPNLSSEAIIGKQISVVLDVLDTDSGEPLVMKALAGNELLNIHKKVCGGDWLVSAFPLLNNKTILGAAVIVNDITETIRLRDEIRRLDSLNLIGEMAASIGHEIRNPMTTIRGFLQYFCKKPDFRPYFEEFSVMVSELDRANDILVDFLSLAKNKTGELTKECLNTVLTKMYSLLEVASLEKGHNLELELGEIGPVMLDYKDIRQLVLNLVHNGFESIEGHGTVTIKTYPEGNNVILAIKDSGSGIPVEILNQLGTPFITTKEHGTGLGLPVCYRVAERHNATISIDTGSNGTTFYISFKGV